METNTNLEQKMKIDTENKEVLFSPIYISKAGKNLTGIITVLLVYFIIMIVLATTFIKSIESNNHIRILILYVLISLVQLTVLILLLSLVYRAGKNLQKSCTIMVRFNDKLISSEDLLVPIEKIEAHRLKAVPQTIQVEKQCPACGNELESKDIECSNCGLNFD